MPPPLHLLGLRPVDLAEGLEARAIRCSLREARQVLSRVISEGASDPTPRREPRKALVEALREHGDWSRPEVVERVPDSEGKSVRYLFRLHDGALVEAVRIGLHKPGAFTVCLSSQVGCAMACTFCATGKLGLARNLAPEEIVGSFLAVRDEAPGRVTGAVFMGQGEPFHNYDAVLRAAHVLADPCGGRIAHEAITISTVGLVPQIHRYTLEKQPFKLIVSLTSAVPERRARLLPVAGRTPLPELLEAVREYAAVSPGRVTLAWVVMRGENTGDDEVAALKNALAGLPCQLNLVEVNGGERPTAEEFRDFLDRLQILGIPLVRRYSVGRDQNSACGMLAATRGAAL